MPIGSNLKNKKNLFKMAQLSSASGLSKSSIHYYLNIGLLHQPMKLGVNTHLYDTSHLARLIRIKELREKQKLSLRSIKTLLEKEPNYIPSDVDQMLEKSVSRFSNKKKRDNGKGKKRRILEVATKMFSKRGYEAVRVDEIAKELKIGKGTIYRYYHSKEALFIDCVDDLSLALVSLEKWREIKHEPQFLSKFKKRTKAFLESFDGYWGILNLAKILSSRKGSELAVKSVESIRHLALPLKLELAEAQEAGEICNIDPELVSFFLLGLAEWAGCLITIDQRYTINETLEMLMEFIAKALSPERKT